MGTGRALSSFLQLPGGGWYNNYRGKKAPQGIRPVTKSGILYGTAAQIQAQIDAWRALIGEFKKLTIRSFTGRLLWQWAELTDVSTPTRSEMKGGWAPYTLTWITAAQNWRRVVYDTYDWTWDDGSWLWGDGTAEFDTGAQIFELEDANETVTVTHDGTIDAPNVTLRFDITAAWQDVTITNQTTGQEIEIIRDEYNLLPLLEIDAGARSMYAATAPKNISSIYRAQNRLNTLVMSPHGLVDDDTVRIEGTDIYDGDYYPVNAVGDLNVLVNVEPDLRAHGVITTGTVRKLTDLYNQATISDINRWMVLAPGDNVLNIVWSPYPVGVTLTVEFVDHFG